MAINSCQAEMKALATDKQTLGTSRCHVKVGEMVAGEPERLEDSFPN